MKAKEAYKILSEQTTIEQIEKEKDNILDIFVHDVHEVIKMRNAKTYSAIKAIVIEANNKWKALVRLCFDSNAPLLKEHITEDQFQIVLSKEPQFARMFDISKPYNAPESTEIHTFKDSNIPKIYCHVVKPLNEITKENLAGELLSCMAAAGSYAQGGIPIPWMKPLLLRIKFLDYWHKNGINSDEIEAFEKDSEGFVKSEKVKSILG